MNYSYKPKEKEENIVENETVETVEELDELEKVGEVEIEKTVEAKEETVKEEEPKPVKNKNALNAKSIPQGFHLLNADSKIIMTLYKTAADDVFIVKGKDAIVFKSGIKWMYSQNDGASTVLKELDIKF
ncbi:hypothetical protein [Winogradskyella sp.]|uniref:hypothetical protein n=1 Tax=Winogradskyella sp. TaxID=1883156 RepID=UPI003513148C